MAFSALLASVADDQVIAFRGETRLLLEADLSIRCSHLLTSWVRPDDLREVLRQAIDGGQTLRADLWHPLRAPVWHPSAPTAEIASQLRKIWAENLEKSGPLDPSDWYGIEIVNVLKVFQHAAASQNGVVSLLEKPIDEERAKKVFLPVVEKDASTSH
jgi:hypothetical protein